MMDSCFSHFSVSTVQKLAPNDTAQPKWHLHRMRYFDFTFDKRLEVVHIYI